MSDLPAGWAEARLREMVTCSGVFTDGDWVESKDQDPNGDVRLIQLADVGDGMYRDRSARFLTRLKAQELDCTYLMPGDVLIARMPDPLGRACIFPGDARTSVTVVDVCVVRPGEDGVNPRWLAHAINSPQIRAAIASYQKGTTRKRISRSNLALIPFPVPPLAEQDRIVAAIEEQFSRLDAGAAGLERVKRHLTRMRAALLFGEVLGRLTADHSMPSVIEVADFEPPLAQSVLELESLNTLPSLPAGWRWADLGSLIAEGPQNGLYLPQSQYGHGQEILRINDFQDGWVRPRADLNLVTTNPGMARAFALNPEDLVINRVNSMSHLGKSTVVSDDFKGVLFESNMMRIHLAPSLLPLYLDMYLRTTLGRSLLVRNAKQAVNQASINQKDVCATPIPVPPVEVQETIVGLCNSVLSLLTSLEAQLAVSLRRSDSLRAAILKAAFSGKLVSQGPNDEPASVLLERIAAERASSNGHKPARSRSQHRKKAIA